MNRVSKQEQLKVISDINSRHLYPYTCVATNMSVLPMPNTYREMEEKQLSCEIDEINDDEIRDHQTLVCPLQCQENVALPMWQKMKHPDHYLIFISFWF